MGRRVFHVRAKSIHRGARQFSARHLNRSQGRNGHAGDVNVIEADDRNVLGNPQSFLLDRLNGADRGHIIKREQGGKSRAPCKELLRDLITEFGGG